MYALLRAGVPLVLAISVLTHPVWAQSWKGQEIVKGGIRHVVNPAESIHPRATVRLEELWRIGGASEEEGEIFGLIRGLAADESGFVYVMDYQLSEVKMFSPQGEFVRTIGREGAGPGELRRPDSICISPTGLVCVAMAYPSRIVQISSGGEPAGTIFMPEGESDAAPILGGTAMAGDHLVIRGLVTHGNEGVRYLAAIDAQGKETVRYYEERHSIDDSNPVFEEKSRSHTERWAAGVDGRVYVASSFDDYEIGVYNPDGDIDHVIVRDYEHRKRTREEKQLVYDLANVNPAAVLPGTRFEIEDYDKDIMALHCREDGTCWVLTSRGFYDRPDGSLGVFDVLDQDGRFVRQVSLLGEGDPFQDRYYFFGDRLYIVTCFVDALATLMGGGEKENKFSTACAEPMSVICYKIEQ